MGTYAGELGATVTALGGSGPLLEVKVPESTTRGLDDADLVGAGVVAASYASVSIRSGAKGHRVGRVRRWRELKTYGFLRRY